MKKRFLAAILLAGTSFAMETSEDDKKCLVYTMIGGAIGVACEAHIESTDFSLDVVSAKFGGILQIKSNICEHFRVYKFDEDIFPAARDLAIAGNIACQELLIALKDFMTSNARPKEQIQNLIKIIKKVG